MAPPITRLDQLLRDVVAAPVANSEVNAICLDSRQVEAGSLFLAMPGVSGDGRDYIQDALDKGAAAIVFESEDAPQLPAVTVPMVAVSGLHRQVGLILNRFYNNPSSRLKVIGVTGTNGKTTCTQLLASILDSADSHCAVIGTLGTGYPGHLDPATHTTPDVATLQKLLAKYADEAAAVCIEVSSHALHQDRVTGVQFDTAVFTNLTRDHLDYHGDMESYGSAKSKLFAAAGLKHAVLNRDDRFSAEIEKVIRGASVITYGLRDADVTARDVVTGHDGIAMTLVTPAGEYPVQSSLYGEFNVSNLLAVAAVLLAMDWDGQRIAAALSDVAPVPGRMEKFEGKPSQPVVVVDYAHTPDALSQALTALRPHTNGLLWCVFGCGGDRDAGKRPLMGAVACRLADRVVLTDDNPRSEDPMQIIAEIESGMTDKHLVIRPRDKAIREAMQNAVSGDVVLVAGKGHEDYQQVGNERFHFSDRELVQELFEEVA
jgi:UDP-N-acetylmuramoyl-L-alanyl-D-glutamate--2,6-diaminopimelate ligase